MPPNRSKLYLFSGVIAQIGFLFATAAVASSIQCADVLPHDAPEITLTNLQKKFSPYLKWKGLQENWARRADLLAIAALDSLVSGRPVLADPVLDLLSKPETRTRETDQKFYRELSDSISTVLPTSSNIDGRGVHALAAAKLYSLMTGKDELYRKLRTSMEVLGVPVTASAMKLAGISEETTATIVNDLWMKYAGKKVSHLTFDDFKKIFGATLSDESPLEMTVALDNGFLIKVYHTDTPAVLTSLPSDVTDALYKLNEAYQSQPTNTVDVFAEQPKLVGKSVYYMVARGPDLKIAGLFAIIVGSPKSPTAAARFGLDATTPVQLELGKALVLKSGRHLLKSFVSISVALLKSKGTSPETPVIFWADQPLWASALRRLGAPELPVTEPGIWAFGALLRDFVIKFEDYHL